MPRPLNVPRLHNIFQPRALRIHSANRTTTLLRLVLLLLIFLGSSASPAYAAPQLSLPTPPGETWKIIQGYGCGTHNGWDHYSLDLANADGRTYGAPVRAAADGTIWVWVSGSGTLILSHGDGFYTMYTHMASVVSTQKGRNVARGEIIGTVGDRGSPGVPHLHFTAFTGHGVAASGRRSVPLSFAEGYQLPEVGGCNQHGGTRVAAGSQAPGTTPGVSFHANLEPGHWYNTDLKIEFSNTGARGFSQAWNHDPGGEMPAFTNAVSGYMQLAWAGEGLHTVYVRTWGVDGQQILASFGPIGYDRTPPQLESDTQSFEVEANEPALISWTPATDSGSGVAGYRLYIGADEHGTSEWYSATPQVQTQPLPEGTYLLRVQALDYAGNAGEWQTIGEIVSE